MKMCQSQCGTVGPGTGDLPVRMKEKDGRMDNISSMHYNIVSMLQDLC